ncbi:hypothetical protein D3C72_1813650 [compost metagenome]
MPGQRPRHRGRARVAGQHWGDAHADRRSAAALETPQGYVLVVFTQGNAVMVAQVFRLGGRAAPRQVGGRRAQDPPIGRQRVGDQRGVAQFADMHHDVPVVGSQARRPVRQRQAGRDVFAALAKVRHQPGDVALAESQRRNHAQMAGHHAAPACKLVGQVVQFPAYLAGP